MIARFVKVELMRRVREKVRILKLALQDPYKVFIFLLALYLSLLKYFVTLCPLTLLSGSSGVLLERDIWWGRERILGESAEARCIARASPPLSPSISLSLPFFPSLC
jgi:hypothetical protein